MDDRFVKEGTPRKGSIFDNAVTTSSAKSEGGRLDDGNSLGATLSISTTVNPTAPKVGTSSDFGSRDLPFGESSTEDCERMKSIPRADMNPLITTCGMPSVILSGHSALLAAAVIPALSSSAADVAGNPTSRTRPRSGTETTPAEAAKGAPA